MRFLIASADYPPDGGGIGAYAHGLWQGLNANGHRTAVVSRATPSRNGSDTERMAAVEAGGTIRANVGALRGWFRELARETKRNACDWTIIPTWDPVAMAATMPLLRASIAGKIAVVFHGSDIASAQGRKAALMRHVMRSSDRLISNSTFTQTLIERAFGKAAATVRPAIGDEDFEIPQAERRANELISVGRLVRRKGHAFVIRAVARLASDFRDLHYTIVGDGPERTRLEDLARTLGVSDRVRFAGQVSPREKRHHLASASIFVLPVREDTADPEGFGIAYLEAGAAGLPVLATRTGGVVECVHDGNSGLFCDDSAVGVEHGLRTLLGNAELRQRLGEGGVRIAGRSRWTNRASDLIQALEDRA